MPAGVMLDDIALPLVQNVRTREDRAWVTHRVPGLEGAAHQHLGRRPMLVTVVGAMADDASLEALERLRRKLREMDRYLRLVMHRVGERDVVGDGRLTLLEKGEQQVED